MSVLIIWVTNPDGFLCLSSQEMGFSVYKTSYFLVCNAKRDAEKFEGSMLFDEYLIPYNRVTG